jgi:hypothetical protein
MHTAGDAMVGMHHIGRSFPFFLIQAVAITFEDLVIHLARRTNLAFHSPLLAQMFGISWVFLWFSCLMPPFIRWSIDLGLTRTEVVPFSPTRMLLGVLEKNGVDIVSVAGFK